MMQQNKFYSLLGICQKAGKLVSGEFCAEKAIKKMQAKLVIVGEDASDNTKKFFRDKCGYRNIPLIIFGTKEQLGHAIGKNLRSSIAILDEGFARKIQELCSK